MGITTTAKTKVSIGTTAAFATAVAYAGDTWTPIANISDVGEAGSEAEVVIGKFVDQDYVRKLKGSRDNGTMELTVARDSADAGYAALIAAEATSFGYNFSVELNDKPAAGASPKNSKFYFNALVASKKNNFGDADNIVSTVFSLAISGAIIEVLASAT
ncbi:phage tail tube protein [Pararhizobium qamdonense]|uniref:phage tail tube protein n=1 Tax=Pararhizobium qamdonense TaxID=3031126 RepID=UPI0023E133E0|nr:phage tail tube protein [Pararhizobium qamdonense]